MLVEFSVANFKSIKEEARLSLVAGPGKEHADSIITVENRAGTSARPLRLLRSAAIYGANAAGKTNVIQGLKTMRDIVLGSVGGSAELPVIPFRFDPACSAEPTTFEVTCMVDHVRYQYGFRATRNEVTGEWLYAWPNGRLQVWFERNRGEEAGASSWKLGGKLTGDREVWKRATRPQALFLSTASSLNSAQLRPLFDWFRRRLHVAGSGGLVPLFREDVLDFLTAADLAIEDVRVVDTEISESKRSVLVKHRPKGGPSAELNMNEESDGTRKLFALAGLWLDSCAEGNVIVFDDLSANLHPAIGCFLVTRFHDQTANPHGAQLVFTTHDTSMLDYGLLRRDQIWFCERNDRLETSLFPLSDFRPRRGVYNLERAYLGGRFGALPYVRISATGISA